MWMWLSRRVRRWVILAVGAPLLAWGLGRLSDQLEARRGQTTTTRMLRSGSAWLDRERPTGRRDDRGRRGR